MKILKCSENTIILNGISLMGDFELHNPNDNLAVVFEFRKDCQNLRVFITDSHSDLALKRTCYAK